MILVLSIIFFLTILIQYMVVFMGLLLDEFSSKSTFLKNLIPFYWVYDIIMTIKSSIARLDEKEKLEKKRGF